MEKLNPYLPDVDYIQNIWNNITSKLERKFDLVVQKNNWLHSDIDLFCKHYDKNIGFGFLLALK